MAMEITSLNEVQLAHFFSSQQWFAEAGVEPAQAAFLLAAALKPFYISLAAAIAAQTDFSFWREGCCPVCGHMPSMALLRAEDGARILECGQCHAQWQFGRLECPFCRNRDFQQLRHFSIDEFPGRRVQVCECCKGYLKTVLGKEMGRRVTLELDNIFTVELDLLTRREEVTSRVRIWCCRDITLWEANAGEAREIVAILAVVLLFRSIRFPA